MLLIKSYFLNERERIHIEEYIEKNVKEISKGEILKMDDNELLDVYRRNNEN